MSFSLLAATLIVLAAFVLLPLLAARAVLGGTEPFDPGPDGFWRASWLRTHYGLRVDADAVKLHARAPRWLAVRGALMVLSAWSLAWNEVLRPFSDVVPAPLRRVTEQMPSRATDLGLGGLVMAFGVWSVLRARGRTDLVLEAQGDLRWHHAGWPAREDGAIPPGDLDDLFAHDDGTVVLRRKGTAQPVVPLFRLRTRRRDEHVLDLRRASDAFKALAARRQPAV